MKKKEENDEYIVPFKGILLSKREANKVGLGIIFGMIGAVITVIVPFTKSKILDLLIVTVFAAVGYFLIGKKVFKK